MCCTRDAAAVAAALLITFLPWLLLGSVSGAGEPEEIMELEEEEEFSPFCCVTPQCFLILPVALASNTAVGSGLFF